MKPFNTMRAGIDRLKLFYRSIRINQPFVIMLILVFLVVIVAGFPHADSRVTDVVAAQAHEERSGATGINGDQHKDGQQSWPEDTQQLNPSNAEASLPMAKLQSELVLMVSIPGFSFLELSPESMQWMPTLQQISEVGKLAALNVRTPERGIEDVYLTINAGAPAIAPLEAVGTQRLTDTIGISVKSLLSGADEADENETDEGGADAFNQGQTTLGEPMISRGIDQNSRFALDSYTRYTGNLVTDHQIVVPNIGYLTTLNNAQTYASRIGRLGDALLANGVRTAVFANRQATESPATGSAPLMLMTSEGAVASGNLSDKLLVYDPSSPGNARTDTARLVKAVKDVVESSKDGDKYVPNLYTGNNDIRNKSTVILIEYGDWYRLDQERRYYEDERWQAARTRELTKLDRFLAELVEITDDAVNGQLWIWSPQPHTQATKEKLHVTPFFHYEGARGFEQFEWTENGIALRERQGLLTSPTTKRAGLISLHDLGPSLLETLGIAVDDAWLGFPVSTASTPDALQQLRTDVGKMQHVYELRTIVVIPFVMIEIIVLLLGLLFVLLKRRRALSWMRWPLYSLLVAPLGILLLGFVPELEPRTQLVILLFMVTIASCIAGCFAARHSILTIAALTAAILLIDGVLGAQLVKYSIMGYDPMIGARYYGIGNEYMGVLVGSAILTCVFAVQHVMRRRSTEAGGVSTSKQHGTVQEVTSDGTVRLEENTVRPTRLQTKRRVRISRRMMAIVTLLWFLAITFYMAAPSGGTNAGGALTASVAFGITWLRLFGEGRLRHVNIWRLAGSGFVLLAAGLIVLWIMNQWLMPSEDMGSKSHIGRAMDLLVSGRFDVIFGMIVRKLEMNLHLIGVSSWGKVLLTSIFVMAVLLLKPRGLLYEWQETRPYWMSGFTAIIIGAIVALALNDSGIVAAGTMIVFAAAPMLLLILEQMPSRTASQLHRFRADR